LEWLGEKGRTKGEYRREWRRMVEIDSSARTVKGEKEIIN